MESSLKRNAFDRRELLRRSVWGSAALAFSSSALLAACGRSAPKETAQAGVGTEQTSTLKYLSRDTATEEVELFQRLQEQFEAAHPGVTVQGEHADVGESFFIRLQTLLGAGAAPDMVPRLEDSLSAELYAGGVTQPADEIIEAFGADRFAPGSLDRVKASDGHYFAVPFTESNMVFWYRTDLLDEAGLSPPTTWDELLTYAKTFTEGKRYGISLPWGRSVPTTRIFYIFLRGNGGNIVDPDLQVVFDSPETIETLEFMKELAQYSPPGSQNYSFPEILGDFVTGTAASTFYTGRVIDSIEDDNPALSGKFTAGAWPNPRGVDGATSYSRGDGPVVVKGNNVELVQKFTTDFMLSKDWYLEWVNLLPGQNIPMIQEWNDTPSYREHPYRQQYTDTIRFIEDGVEQGTSILRESPEHPANPMAGTLDSGSIIPDMMQDILVLNRSIPEAVSTAASKMKEVMEDAEPV